METQAFSLFQVRFLLVLQLLVTWQTDCMKWLFLLAAEVYRRSLKIVHQLLLPLDLIMISGNKEP